MEKLMLLTDSKKMLNQPTFFVHIFFRVFIIAKFEFCAYLAYLFSQMKFTRKFRVFNFAKSTNIYEIPENMYKQKLVSLR